MTATDPVFHRISCKTNDVHAAIVRQCSADESRIRRVARPELFRTPEEREVFVLTHVLNNRRYQ